MIDEESTPTLSSTKNFILTVLSLVLVTGGYLVAAPLPAIVSLYSTFVMAIATILTIAHGSHVGSNWIMAKHGALPQDNDKQDQEENIEKPKGG